MRSKIGTQSRLAAHIAALFLLILMLVYIAPPAAEPVAPVAPAAPAVAEPIVVEPVIEPVIIEEPAVAAAAEPVVEPVIEPAVPVEPEPVAAVAEPVVETAPVVEEPVSQPDESGALVVAPAETGASEVVVAPLKNANLEVLGDGVYWLSPKHDLEKELAAIPEIAGLVVLAPLPGQAVAGFDHVKTDVISADPADLTRDAADRFVHLAGRKPGPVVAAALPGARGAAFFKAAYLLRSRNMSPDEALDEVAAELDEAGSSRGEVLHRLLRLAGPEEAAEETHDSGGD